jgi:uncharacterized membrane protein
MSTTASAPGGSGTLRCARHPNTETVLRCGRCETPICPRCLVSTPVGARCPSCAQVKRFATLLKPRELAQAVAYGVAVGAVGTVVLSFIPFLGLIGYAILGFGVGEVVSVGANRKRLRELGPIAVACLFVGYEIGIIALLLFEGAPLGVELLLFPIQALTRGLLILGLLLGALLAWMRVR